METWLGSGPDLPVIRGVTDEEALLRLQQLETDFEYGVSLGFSFQFGSIFNNVVNNRFRNAQGFGGGSARLDRSGEVCRTLRWSIPIMTTTISCATRVRSDLLWQR